jgi:hypothetical protein
LSLPVAIFGVGMLLLIASYILGTPAWLGLASVQVDEAHQAKALSLMQTSQGFGLMLGTGLVMSASALLVRSEQVYHAMQARWPKFHLSERGARIVEMDAVPISFWLWASAFVFFLCLVGSLLWLREPEHHGADEHTEQQPPVPSEV